MTEQEPNADLLCSDEQFQNESFVETEQQIHIVNSAMKSEDISDTHAQTSGVHNVYLIGHWFILRFSLDTNKLSFFYWMNLFWILIINSFL